MNPSNLPNHNTAEVRAEISSIEIPVQTLAVTGELDLRGLFSPPEDEVPQARPWGECPLELITWGEPPEEVEEEAEVHPIKVTLLPLPEEYSGDPENERLGSFLENRSKGGGFYWIDPRDMFFDPDNPEEGEEWVPIHMDSDLLHEVYKVPPECVYHPELEVEDEFFWVEDDTSSPLMSEADLEDLICPDVGWQARLKP